eukprot:378558-Rhodomonas_salina.2
MTDSTERLNQYRRALPRRKLKLVPRQERQYQTCSYQTGDLHQGKELVGAVCVPCSQQAVGGS